MRIYGKTRLKLTLLIHIHEKFTATHKYTDQSRYIVVPNIAKNIILYTIKGVKGPNVIIVVHTHVHLLYIIGIRRIIRSTYT